MGMLRALLAFAVVLLHVPPFPASVLGGCAVPMFYVISGFLISLTLTEGRRYPSAKKFYLNRALRIFPVYLVTAWLTLVQYQWAGYNWATFSDFHLSAKILQVVTNVTLLGQDWLFFLATNGASLIWTTDTTKTATQWLRSACS